MEKLKNTVVAMVAIAIIIGFSSFKVWEKANVTEVTFRYEAPASNPYSEMNVTETDNWKPNPSCDEFATNEVACSITVPIESTLSNGTIIDPLKVEILTEPSDLSGNNHRVIANPSDYTNPINQPLP